ncbi:MAG: hypothetical protein ACM3O7_04365 [Acidobacteriota bacterium]
MDILSWLQALGRDADPARAGFQAQPMYLLVSVLLPVSIGLIVGFGLRLIERVFGVELGRGGGH